MAEPLLDLLDVAALRNSSDAHMGRNVWKPAHVTSVASSPALARSSVGRSTRRNVLT
jgi:hypothetical protein